MKNNEKFTNLLILFGIAVCGSIWRGYVLSLLWGWLIVPTFSLPLITVVQAIGLSFVLTYLTARDNPNVALEPADKFIKRAALRPATALMIGWVVKQWI
jgi:hypothetical protein